MAPAEFKGLVSPSKTQHPDTFDIVTFFAKDSFTLPTLLLLGSLLQITLSTLLPKNLALLPAASLTLYALSTTLFQLTRNPHQATSMKKVLPGRTSAQLPNTETATFGSQPAAEPIVVFHFGIKINHALGWLAPGAKTTLDHFTACNDLIISRAHEYGMLGMSPWRGGERGSNNTLMMVYYFRDVEALNKFAHGDLHRKAWDWIVKAGYMHIGFFHEAFCVPRGAYESIYVNCQPLLMGQTSVKCVDGDGGEEVWVRPIVDADTGALRSQFGRMGRAFKEHI